MKRIAHSKLQKINGGNIIKTLSEGLNSIERCANAVDSICKISQNYKGIAVAQTAIKYLAMPALHYYCPSSILNDLAKVTVVLVTSYNSK